MKIRESVKAIQVQRIQYWVHKQYIYDYSVLDAVYKKILITRNPNVRYLSLIHI